MFMRVDTKLEVDALIKDLGYTYRTDCTVRAK
jgi:hypothetical protein